MNSIHRWVINSVDKDVLRNALMANGWHITNPFQGEEKTAVHIIAVYCGLVAQPLESGKCACEEALLGLVPDAGTLDIHSERLKELLTVAVLRVKQPEH